LHYIFAAAEATDWEITANLTYEGNKLHTFSLVTFVILAQN